MCPSALLQRFALSPTLCASATGQAGSHFWGAFQWSFVPQEYALICRNSCYFSTQRGFLYYVLLSLTVLNLNVGETGVEHRRCVPPSPSKRVLSIPLMQGGGAWFHNILLVFNDAKLSPDVEQLSDGRGCDSWGSLQMPWALQPCDEQCWVTGHICITSQCRRVGLENKRVLPREPLVSGGVIVGCSSLALWSGKH